MPLREYGCHECGVKFEVLIVGDKVAECPRCGPEGDLEELVSTFAMSFSTTLARRGRCANMYENFTVPHVRDKRTGKPIVVNSLKELRAAEKEHHFAYALASDDNALKSEAPLNTPWAGDIRHDYNWKWARDPRQQNDRRGVSVGSGTRSKNKKAVA